MSNGVLHWMRANNPLMSMVINWCHLFPLDVDVCFERWSYDVNGIRMTRSSIFQFVNGIFSTERMGERHNPEDRALQLIREIFKLA